MGQRLEIDTTVLDRLDFHFDQPCEHSNHPMTHEIGDIAAYYIHSVCGCGGVADLFLCKSGYDRAGRTGIQCDRGPRYARDEVYTILRVL